MCSSNLKSARVVVSFLPIPNKSSSHSTIIPNIAGLTLKELISLPQPSHLLAIIVTLYFSFVFFPKQPRPIISEDGPSTITTLIYIATFATHFGSQMWMTFVSGIVLFLTIPRNLFAQVQRILFPLYFFLNSVLGFITLVAFIQHHPSQLAQVWCLCLCLLIELCTRIYVVPTLLDSLEQRMELEAAAGVGNEIGRHQPGQLNNNQQYLKLHQRFRGYHALCAIGNLSALACNVTHLYFIASLVNR